MSRHRNQIRPSAQLPTDSLTNQPKQITTPVTLSFEYVSPGDRHCISYCTQEELKDVADCFRQLSVLPWVNVLQQGSKQLGMKKGLAYTPYQDHALKTVRRPQRLSAEIGIGAVRASRGARVFGAYYRHVFYVLWFDRNHEIVPFGK